MALIFDLADPQELQGFVREIQRERDENRFVLSQIIPNNNIDDIEYRVNRGDLQDEPAAPIRNWDTESPIGSRQGTERVMGELPPISKKIPITEEQRLRRRAIETGDNAALVSAIYNDAANMARAVSARVEMLRGEALFNGSIEIDENGVVQSIPMGRTASHSAAANTLAGTDLWSDYDDSDPIAKLTTWLETYLDDTGVLPAFILCPRTVPRHLARNETLRVLRSSLSGSPEVLPVGAVNNLLADYDIPPFVPYDVLVRDIDGTQVRVTPNNQILFVPPADEPLGATFFGTTAESLELVEAQQIDGDQAPGLTSVVEHTTDPVSTWTKVVGIALPVLINPDLTFVAQVL